MHGPSPPDQLSQCYWLILNVTDYILYSSSIYSPIIGGVDSNILTAVTHQICEVHNSPQIVSVARAPSWTLWFTTVSHDELQHLRLGLGQLEKEPPVAFLFMCHHPKVRGSRYVGFTALSWCQIVHWIWAWRTCSIHAPWVGGSLSDPYLSGLKDRNHLSIFTLPMLIPFGRNREQRNYTSISSRLLTPVIVSHHNV